jgi:carbonic anhydrase
MSRKQGFGLFWLALIVLWLAPGAKAVSSGACQIAPEPIGKPQEQHQHGGGHHMNIPDTAGEKCDPKFTYTPGPHDPSHWEGVCNVGKMQSPIDITHSEKLHLPEVGFGYQPAPLKVFNDCNDYQVKLWFPDNFWLKVGKKPYFLTQLHFHEPAEHAVNGKRADMAIHLVHLSPESNFLVIEIPVVVGKENPVIKSIWQHIPEAGKEQTFPAIKINAMDLLPVQRDYYRLPGSLTTPICNEGVTWFVMKDPIEMSAAQIAEYKRRYHNTARPLQPANDRPVAEPIKPGQ